MAVCSDLCHNNIILLPYFLLLSKIQKRLCCSFMQDQTVVLTRQCMKKHYFVTLFPVSFLGKTVILSVISFTLN